MPYDKYTIRTGVRNFTDINILQRDKETVNYVDDSPVCAYAEGRMFEDWVAYKEFFSADAGSDTLTIIYYPNYFRAGQKVRLTTDDTLPGGLSAGTDYYVINPSGSTLQLSTSSGGGAVNISSTGTGNHTITRYNGYADGDLMENPAYIAESVLRDECYVKRDLVITDGTISTTSVQINELGGETEDYYHGAIHHNVTSDHKSRVGLYEPSTRQYSLYTGDASMNTGDKVYLTNVRGDEKIHSSSFDKIGDANTGLRDGWIFGHSINQKTDAQNILSQLCYESHCQLFESSEGWKLVALDPESGSVDTWTVPLNRNSERELIYAYLTPLANIRTDFKLRYNYNYGRQDYIKEMSVNSSGYNNEYNTSLALQQNQCLNAEKNYKVSNKWEYSSDWIYDTDTAVLFLKKIVNWLTVQKLVISWTGEQKTYMKYEKGDQVKLNYSAMIPASKNNSSLFMITDKTVSISKENPMVTFTLMEMV